MYKEANEVKRSEYLDNTKDLTKEKIVYIDESEIKTKDAVKERWWGKR
jgi:hypothetical protein